MIMPAEYTEMLLVGSDDYWGHSGAFDSAVNFYPHTFILNRDAYEGLEDDSDRSRFFPCALFYYRGETDNHGFTPAQIGVMVNESIASIGRVEGIDRVGNRERRTYTVGGETGYSIPGTNFTMMQAPDLNTYSAIETAANDDELTVPGRFNITDLRFNVDEVVSAINQTAGIETSEAETMGPVEPIPTNPNDYTPMTGPSPEEISSSESHEAVEYMAEGGTYTHTVGNYTQDSSQAGHGVPEYYGSGSAGETRMEYDEMNSEWNDYVGKRVAHEMRGYYRTGVVGDSPPIFAGPRRQTIARMSKEDKRKYYEQAGVKGKRGWNKGANRWQAMKVARGVAMNEAERKGLHRAEGFGPYEPDLESTPIPPSHNPPEGYGYETRDEGTVTEAMLAEGIVLPGTEEEVSGETNLQGWGQGDIVGTIIANYDGTPFGFRAEGDEFPIDGGYYPNSYGESSAVTSGAGVPQWYGSAETIESNTVLEAEYFESEGEFTRADLISMVDEIRSMIDELDVDDMDDLDDLYTELMEIEDQLENYIEEEIYASEGFGLGDYTGPLDDGMGEGSAAGSGYGVPQWYGSAEETFEATTNGSTLFTTTNAAILIGASVVGALVANFMSKKGDTETVADESGSVKENKGNGD